MNDENKNINAAELMQATEFASFRHRNQKRKGEKQLPYIHHPIQVATLLAVHGGESDRALLIAALLHDTIEDTVETEEESRHLQAEIIRLFGQEVLDIVLEVTDDKKLEKKERKRLQVEHAPHLSTKAKKLKLADKIANCKELISDPPAGWPLQRKTDYLDWSEQVVRGLKGANEKLEELFTKSVSEGRKLLIREFSTS